MSDTTIPKDVQECMKCGRQCPNDCPQDKRTTDARDIASDLAYGLWERNKLYDGARNAWMNYAANIIESYVAERERITREETARKCADAAVIWQHKLCQGDDWTCLDCVECDDLRAVIQVAARVDDNAV